MGSAILQSRAIRPGTTSLKVFITLAVWSRQMAISITCATGGTRRFRLAKLVPPSRLVAIPLVTPLEWPKPAKLVAGSVAKVVAWLGETHRSQATIEVDSADGNASALTGASPRDSDSRCCSSQAQARREQRVRLPRISPSSSAWRR